MKYLKNIKNYLKSRKDGLNEIGIICSSYKNGRYQYKNNNLVEMPFDNTSFENAIQISIGRISVNIIEIPIFIKDTIDILDSLELELAKIYSSIYIISYKLDKYSYGDVWAQVEIIEKYPEGDIPIDIRKYYNHTLKIAFEKKRNEYLEKYKFDGYVALYTIITNDNENNDYNNDQIRFGVNLTL